MGQTNMLAAVALAVMCTTTQAAPVNNCGYGLPYDQTPPPAIIAPGGNGQSVRFEWGTDADTLTNGSWIWNYITNKSPAGLGVNWDKGQIHQSIWYGSRLVNLTAPILAQ